MFLLILLIVILSIVFVLEVKNYRIKKFVNRIPGPPTLPVLGNAHQMAKTPSENLKKLFLWWNKYGKTNYRIWIGYVSNIIITDVKDMEYILTSNEAQQKSDIYDMFHPWLGTGLLTSFGPKWFTHRKMITPSFHFKILQEFHEVMNENSTKFMEKLEQASAGDSIFDIQEFVHYLTLDIICDTAMGVHVNAMDQNDSEIVKAFKYMCYNINERTFHPLKRNNAFYRFFPEYPQYKRTLKVLQDFTYDVIEKRKRLLEEETENLKTGEHDEFSRRKRVFLDTLLTANIDGQPLTMEEVYEEVSTFVFEGHDTTTSGIAFAVYLLSRHRTIQEKVFAEQQQIFGSDMQRDATFNEISQMKYLELVIKEAQRLYPSVPYIARYVDHDFNMNGKIIPRGSSLLLLLICMGYNDKVYADPYKCRPERFDLDKRTTNSNPFEYIPFSAGPRNCIGQKFAMLELKTVVSKIVRRFEILPPLDELASLNGDVQHFCGLTLEEQRKRRPNPHKYDPILASVVTLKSDNGIHIRLRSRHR